MLSLGVLSGCAGLTQFSATSLHYGHDLTKKDSDYAAALSKMKETDANKKRDLRDEIDRRLRVIDLNFDAFVAALSKESVRANFGVAVAQVGLGAAGALVWHRRPARFYRLGVRWHSAGVWQGGSVRPSILRPAGSNDRQSKGASGDDLQGPFQRGSVDDYSLSAAMQDIDGSYFAGTLPGAVVATSADATKKKAEAEDLLAPAESVRIGRRRCRPVAEQASLAGR